MWFFSVVPVIGFQANWEVEISKPTSSLSNPGKELSLLAMSIIELGESVPALTPHVSSEYDASILQPTQDALEGSS